MPLFITDEELERYSHDASSIVEKADSFIEHLQRQLHTLRAQADASTLTAEQTCALLEQKYLSLLSDFSKLESENSQLSASLEQKLSELAEAQDEKQQLQLKLISKDKDVEQLSSKASELQKSKKQLAELLERKDTDIGGKGATITNYLDRIATLTAEAALKEVRLHDQEMELEHIRSASVRLSQEKELLEKHNISLTEELSTKIDSLVELRRMHNEFEADMSSELRHVERQFDDCSKSLRWHKERVGELEMKLTSLQEELLSTKDATAANEEHLSAEKSALSKLVDLYKESSEEWSRKAGELEGVIKALETHLGQVEDDYKEKLDKQASAAKAFEKEAAILKEKLTKCELEIQNARKSDNLSLLPLSSMQNDSSVKDSWINGTENDGAEEDSRILVPKIPIGVSETALAATLLRNGWSLAKMYEKYQEAVDAYQHEELGRKHSQAILEQIMHEIEEKAVVISEEREEHERMAEAYNLMNENFQESLSEKTDLQRIINRLKVEMRRHEQDYVVAQKEIKDLQKQVTVLLKECQDIQLRCGVATDGYPDDSPTSSVVDVEDGTKLEQLTFKDINGLVEQNIHLQSLVHSLTIKNDLRDAEFKEKFELELQNNIDQTSSKVASVLARCEEQGRMIESLHSSVAMYKRLYEEGLKSGANYPPVTEAIAGDRKDLLSHSEGSQEARENALVKATEQVKDLQEELNKSRTEATALRSNCDKMAMEVNFARERLDSFVKEFEHQRDEINGLQARNVELSQLIVDYQEKMRKTTESLSAFEDSSKKYSMELSVLKQERDILIDSEKRASNEACNLSEKVHHLQARLESICNAEEIREASRVREKQKQEEFLKAVERELNEAKKDLQEEREHVRTITLDREEILKNAMRKTEEMSKELAHALRAIAASEARAAKAEAKCSSLIANLSSYEKKVVEDGGHEHSACSGNEVTEDLQKANEEILKLKDESRAYKERMIQYKEIAQVNEMALKQIESAHEIFKDEADKLKRSLESEILSLRSRVLELENDVISKSTEATSLVVEKEKVISSGLAEMKCLEEENSKKTAQIATMEVQISSLKEDLEKEHQQRLAAQKNYERQVILQSETIQELMRTSQALAQLQDDASELHKLLDAQKSESALLKATWEAEKSILQELKDGAEKKYNEINEQNKILLSHLEALHIKLAEKERISAGISSRHTKKDPDSDDDLQELIGYLQRSKEMAETEISLLKQEKLQLQCQLENALKASETAQALVHSEPTSSKSLLLADEQFDSLKHQVREMNLLRESNMQLREENKYNFEECQKYREIAQKAKTETEHLVCLLKEKETGTDDFQKEIEMKNKKIEQLEWKMAELQERYKSFDLEEYDRMKQDIQRIKVTLSEKEATVEEANRLLSEQQQHLSSLEQGLASGQLELAEMQKKMSESLQVEATIKSEAEKQKKIASHLKKRVEMLNKKNEELSSEKRLLSKQLEDAISSKKPAGENMNEQKLKEKEKEKDTRIQMLERTLEREREELRKEKEDRRKEKSIQQKIEKIIQDHMQTVHQEKKKLLEELEMHKQERDNLLEISGIIPSETGSQHQTAAYLLAVDNFDAAVNSVLDGLAAQPVPGDPPSANVSPAATGQQAPEEALVPLVQSTGSDENSSQFRMTEEREKITIMQKSVETRKVGRKLVRPPLKRMREPKAFTEASGKEGLSSSDVAPHSEVSSTSFQLVRKRFASSPASEVQEELVGQQTVIADGAPLKKSKGLDKPQETSKESADLTSLENLGKPSRDLDDSFGHDLVHALNDSVNTVKHQDVDDAKEPSDQPKQSSDSMNEKGVSNEDFSSIEALMEKPQETPDVSDFLSDIGLPEQQSLTEMENEREDGELIPDETPQEGSDPSGIMMELESVEYQSESAPAAPGDVSDVAEVGSSGVLILEKIDTTEVRSKAVEGSDKPIDHNDRSASESQPSTQASVGTGEGLPNVSDSIVSTQGSPSFIVEPEEGKESQAGKSTTTIVISERAKANAALRQARLLSPVDKDHGKAPGVVKKDGGRGRGRQGIRGRQVRRGQSSGDKEQA